MEEYNFLVNGRRHRMRLLKHEKESTYLIEVDGKTSRVKLPEEFRYGSPFSLKIAEKTHKVELNKINKNTQFSIKIKGKTYTVKTEEKKTIPTPAFKLPPLKLEKKPVRKTVLEAGVVTAPMPGKVVLLRVKVGDFVRAGEPLCVLEAMKMENEITALRTGTVKEILISEGVNVNYGEALFVIE